MSENTANSAKVITDMTTDEAMVTFGLTREDADAMLAFERGETEGDVVSVASETDIPD